MMAQIDSRRPRGPRAPYSKGVAKRAEILDCALRLYGISPGHAPTLSAIADEANLTEAGVLHYFGSKTELFVEVLRSRDARIRDHYDVDDPNFVWQYLQDMTKTPGLMRLFEDMSLAATDPEHPAAAFMVEHENLARQVITRALNIDDEEIINTLIATAEGLSIRWLRDPSVDIVGSLRSLIRSLGLLPANDQS
ncbi:TetR/AcrR family transcriptional regulator [uncultured Kocuria sp.]|uniref:TetR/AcrR family transcriptional regulator n=1 Tax=uncultured Kocuria sp. TaxID=259305 RepID=UPI0025957B80|nr:TetR/AcrR family transcriptional regulator [uncultured Kocuria sp.]